MSDSQEIQIPLLIVGAEDTPIYFSNFLVVQHLDREFILTFGQYAPPLDLPGPENERRIPPYVPVRAVARIGLTPQRMRELIEILQSNYNKWRETSEGEG
jgi:hypothetical protein